MRDFVALLAAVFLLAGGGCHLPDAPPSAAALIDSARAAHGAPVLHQAVVTFEFRGEVHRINGVRMADCYNYTIDTLSADRLAQYPGLLDRNALRLVSRIELDSVQVRSL